MYKKNVEFCPYFKKFEQENLEAARMDLYRSFRRYPSFADDYG